MHFSFSFYRNTLVLSVCLLVITFLSSSASVYAQGTQASSVPVYNSITQLQNRIDAGGDTLYMINFWATWCKPCVEELPLFETFQAKNQAKKVKVLLVSLDFKSQIERRLIPFIQEQKLRSEVLVLADPNYNTWIAQVNDRWDGAIPATLITQNGKRYFEQKTFKSVAEIETLLTQLGK